MQTLRTLEVLRIRPNLNVSNSIVKRLIPAYESWLTLSMKLNEIYGDGSYFDEDANSSLAVMDEQGNLTIQLLLSRRALTDNYHALPSLAPQFWQGRCRQQESNRHENGPIQLVANLD